MAAAWARGAEEPRATVARAVEALGGEALLGKVRAVYLKAKGVHTLSGEPSPFRMEVFSQPPERTRETWYLGPLGKVMTQALNGDEGWYREDGTTLKADQAFLAEMKDSAYVTWVMGLLPLLKKNGHKLGALGEVKIDDQTAVGVNVSHAGHPDVKLFFDKKSGLLVRSEFKRKEGGKDVRIELTLSDYRDVFSASTEEAVLRAARLGTENAELLEFLRKRTLSAAKRQQVRDLIRKLGDAAFDVREKAKEDLIKEGEPAAALVTRALKDADPEVSSRAKECLQALGKPVDGAVVAAVLHLIALRRPPGAAEGLLAYLPCVANEDTAQEVQAALAAVAVHNGKQDTFLVQALEDKDPERRAAAAAALGRGVEPGKERAGQQLFLPGIKHARKGVILKDGQKVEYEVEEVKYFNKFKDEVFVKP
jgi:hypothetical protein